MVEWCPFAIRRDGPAHKFGGYAAGNSGPKRGEVKHSMVGSFAAAMGVLDGPRAASWHFSVNKDGSIYQHYPLSANTWHGGDSDDDGAVRANIDLVGTEHEGGPIGNESEPLTAAQLGATTMLSQWCAEQAGLSVFARYPTQGGVFTLVEHNQVSNTPTACPSGRIPWDVILKELNNPPPPPKPAEGAGSMVIIGHPTNQRSFLVVGSNAYHIPDGPTWDDLRLLLYGTQPHKVRQETWDWLKANEIIGGLFD